MIQEIDIKIIAAYENNPRKNDAAVDKVAESIKEFGFKVPIVVDENNVVVTGHTRLKAARKLGMKTVPCIVANDLTPEQVKAYRLADNKTAEFADWDMDLLEQELAELQAQFDMSLFGFDTLEAEQNSEELTDDTKMSLQEKFIIPPFSIFDTRQGYWQDRKKVWKQIIKSDVGREENLLGEGLSRLADMQGAELTGTSIFDPVLCEILINWFCPVQGKILDPFAGGSVRGLVSVLTGREYTGIDLRPEQIQANIKNFTDLFAEKDLRGLPLNIPNWICDDSFHIDNHIKEKHDFLLTCPPYADLEVYSDDERDLSNMKYEQFLEAYKIILLKSFAHLKENAFAAIVVGDIRDKKGYYRNFVSDTILIAKSAGLKLYNECILIEVVATAALRANRQFSAGRKVVKTHQNVLIFIKGDEKQIELEELDYDIEDLQYEIGAEEIS